MAEILFMATDTANVGKDSGAYALGDVVYIGEDGHAWGTNELDKRIFNIIKVPGTAAAVRAAIAGPQLDNKGVPISPARCKVSSNQIVDKKTSAVMIAATQVTVLNS